MKIGPKLWPLERSQGFSMIFPQGWGHFWPQGYNLNNLGRGPLDEASYQIAKTWALWFQRRRFLKIFPMCLCKTLGPRGGAIFGPRAII